MPTMLLMSAELEDLCADPLQPSEMLLFGTLVCHPTPLGLPSSFARIEISMEDLMSSLEGLGPDILLKP
jgi:hypothetical protein